MLTEAQCRARDGKLTASRVGVLMSGDAAAIYALWREMIGDPDYKPEDLSDVWAVQLGSCTENLNLDWYERRTGRSVTRRGDVVVHPTLPWAAATLDGWDEAMPGPVEAKHVNGFSKVPDVVTRYQPQVHWQMLVTGAEAICLSVIIGASEPERETIALDRVYADELMARAQVFWSCVETLTPPVALPAVAAPVLPEALRTVDMTGSNAWADAAARLLAHHAAAKSFDAAIKDIKTLIAPDVKLAYGHGIKASRAKNGAVKITEVTP